MRVKANPKTVLIFRIGSIGDTVVALPSFHRIERSYPDWRRILITDIPVLQKAAPVEAILAKSGLIHDTIYFPFAGRKLGDLLKLRAAIRATGADTLIYVADRDLRSTVRDIVFFHLCGLKHIIGAPLARGLRRPLVDPATGIVEPEAERLARVLSPLGPVDLSDPEMWDLRLQPTEIAAGEAAVAPLRGQKFIAVNMGGKVEMKDWGDANWCTLLRLAAKEFGGVALVFVGSDDESERASRISATWPGRSLNLCGHLSPRESAAAMRDAMAFVGHDSGPMHLAAAMGVTCVSLFGNFNEPKWWHPYGDRHQVIHDLRGVRSITPDQVFEALRKTLAEHANNTHGQISRSYLAG